MSAAKKQGLFITDAQARREAVLGLNDFQQEIYYFTRDHGADHEAAMDEAESAKFIEVSI